MEVNHEGDWEVWDLCLLVLINAECLFFSKGGGKFFLRINTEGNLNSGNILIWIRVMVPLKFFSVPFLSTNNR